MPSHRLSASKTELGLMCLWWARPDVPEWPDTPGREALVGTAAHNRIARTLNPSFAAETVDLTEAEELHVIALHEAWQADWYERERANGWEAEQIFALDPRARTAIRLRGRAHRDYSDVPEGYIPMTVDAVRWGSVEVVDWKSGLEATPAVRNPQIATIALAAALIDGTHEAQVSIAYLRPDGVHEDRATLDSLDLLEWCDRLAMMLDELPTAKPKPGPHCRGLYCPAFGACPETRQALERVAPAPLDGRRHLPIALHESEIEGPEHAQYVYRRLREAKASIDQAWEAMRRWADAHGGIPLEGGKTYIKREISRETIDLATPAAVTALRESLGEEAWMQAVALETSKAGIERAARSIAKAEGSTIKAVQGRAVAALRAVGAITSKKSTKYEEVALKEGA